MRDVLGKMRECGKYIKMRDFPHDCGMVDTYEIRPKAVFTRATFAYMSTQREVFEGQTTARRAKRGGL